MKQDLGVPGHEIKKINPRQYRIDGVLDVWPKEKRWHNVRTMQRGSFRVDMVAEILEQLSPGSDLGNVVK